ncbi:sensor histidine kinase [Caenimonas aquaedulcis]|uniref:histidine kinase n=1 Tax=Caenimonas aquaedulcis TaxID=2793270 RepID=A0A931H197_9BURK|nr:7TM diverse intracellular signaling domain-containing protein [Caenimonas aquaedulcis]MBG9386693.1 PAS domain S-box protein [Caenimonas aquaedulcis]
MRAWCLAFACWLVLACAHAQAPGPSSSAVIPIGADPSYPLTRSFQYLEDPTGRLTLDDILAPARQAQFRPLARTGPGANFGLTDSAIWLRATLATTTLTPNDWLLEIAYPPLDQLELYAPDDAFGYDRQVGGDTRPFAERAIAHRNHVLPLRLPRTGEATIYLRVQSEGTVSVPATLWRPAALWQRDLAAYATLSLYFGLLIGLLLYNLLLWVSVRDSGYLIYVGFVAFMGLGQAALTGLGAQFLWTPWTWWNTVSPPVGLAGAALFGLQFARNFLSSAVRMPRIDRFLLVQMAGWAAAIAAALTLPYSVSSYMVTGLAVVSVASMVAIGVISIRRDYAGARNFFGAWTLLLIGVVTLALHNVGVLPSNIFTANALLIGSALEMVMLSFALADRINVARRFKEQAQARIAAEHAMVEALAQSQSRLKAVLEERENILENSIVGIVFLTAKGRMRWANRAMLDIFGARANQVHSMERFYLSREEYLEVGAEVAAHAARGETYQRELEVQKFDGTRGWIFLSGKAVSREDLSQGTVWVIMDITQRKALEEQLKKNNSEREAILNSALVGIVLSVARRHEWVNEKFASMLGYPRQVLIGQPSSYIHPDEESWERFGREARAALIETGSYICERQLKRRSGELFWVEMGGSCIRPNDPDSGVIWTFLDITGRKKSEAEMIEALEQQKALNELRNRFVAMTSHEFRTPLAAIMSAEELLRHYGDRLPQAERLEVLDSIASGVQRMSRMMDRVLLLGKADAGMLEFAPERIDIVPLCRKFVDEARAQQPDSTSVVVTDFEGNPGPGDYDEKLLRHIFSNLLSNALKYSPAGGEVGFKVRRTQGATEFEVADQGIGIPAEEVSHLFGSFHRASNVGSIPGTGLGLAIVKNAVEMHGGEIRVRSELGRGTTFTVKLPG